jgi:ATP-dependent DNA helicase RecQ
MNQRLQKVSRHDHRLATAISMLDRHGVVAGASEPDCFDVQRDLPQYFRDEEQLNEKKRRDQQRLYAMVQYANHEGDRKEFLNDYFLGSES